jgi:hypothetical protein
MPITKVSFHIVTHPLPLRARQRAEHEARRKEEGPPDTAANAYIMLPSTSSVWESRPDPVVNLVAQGRRAPAVERRRALPLPDRGGSGREETRLRASDFLSLELEWIFWFLCFDLRSHTFLGNGSRGSRVPDAFRVFLSTGIVSCSFPVKFLFSIRGLNG